MYVQMFVQMYTPFAPFSAILFVQMFYLTVQLNNRIGHRHHKVPPYCDGE
jgi:hypothetical protein